MPCRRIILSTNNCANSDAVVVFWQATKCESFVKRLLVDTVELNVNATDSRRHTALHAAVESAILKFSTSVAEETRQVDEVEMLKILTIIQCLYHGGIEIDVKDIFNRTALCIALEYRLKNIVEILLNNFHAEQDSFVEIYGLRASEWLSYSERPLRVEEWFERMQN